MSGVGFSTNFRKVASQIKEYVLALLSPKQKKKVTGSDRQPPALGSIGN